MVSSHPHLITLFQDCKANSLAYVEENIVNTGLIIRSKQTQSVCHSGLA